MSHELDKIDSFESSDENSADRGNLPTPWENSSLDQESMQLLAQIIEETDVQKAQDLTYLFNLNQNKKTMVRMDKLSGLQDGLVNQFLKRVRERPDEISNKELMDGVRLVQDILERGQRQVSGVDSQPLIQINQQTNSVSIGGDSTTELDRESRERVKNAVLGLLNNLKEAPPTPISYTDFDENSRPDSEEVVE